MSDQKQFDVIAHYLRTELFPRSDLLSQRVLLSLYRLIAKGSPVTLESLGATLGIDNHAVKEVIELVAPSRLQFDEAGRIIAFAGFSQVPTGHRFMFGKHELFTWCAFDTLFLPRLLGGNARVSSSCPVTDAEIRVTVTKDGLEDVQPDGAVMSFVMPEVENCCTDLRGAFCNHVNFLASRQAGVAWLERNADAAILSLHDAFALGQIRNQSGFSDVLADDTGQADAEPITSTSSRGAQ